jgi:hypothetical protein
MLQAMAAAMAAQRALVRTTAEAIRERRLPSSGLRARGGVAGKPLPAMRGRFGGDDVNVDIAILPNWALRGRSYAGIVNIRLKGLPKFQRYAGLAEAGRFQ